MPICHVALATSRSFALFPRVFAIFALIASATKQRRKITNASTYVKAASIRPWTGGPSGGASTEVEGEWGAEARVHISINLFILNTQHIDLSSKLTFGHSSSGGWCLDVGYR